MEKLKEYPISEAIEEYHVIDIFYNCISNNIININYVKSILKKISDNYKIQYENVLDLGFGTGCLTIPFSYFFNNSYGIDINPYAHGLIGEKIDKLKISNLQLITCDWKLCDEYFVKDFFDLIICWGNSLIYSSAWPGDKNTFDGGKSSRDIEDTLQSCNSILRKNGLLAIQTISRREIANLGCRSIVKISNSHESNLLEWNIHYDGNMRISDIKRTQILNDIISTSTSRYIGYAIFSDELIKKLKKIGFEECQVWQDINSNYDIIIAQK